jgi:hypothetical protein
LFVVSVVVVGDEGERERRRKEGEGESDGIEWSYAFSAECDGMNA